MKKTFLICIAALGFLSFATAFSQSIPNFPEGAIQINTAELQEAIAGKSFSVDLKPERWTVAFESKGRYVFAAGTWKESGKWTSNKSEICGKDFGGWCNEIRVKDDVLFLKSNSRGILPMALVK